MGDNILTLITDKLRQDNQEKFTNFSPPSGTESGGKRPSLEKRLAEEFTVIAEVKKASPSKGIIADDFDPVKIASEYEKGGAGCVSVLTEENYFLGSLEHLKSVSESVKLPVLRKDFIIDISQIYEAFEAGADVILLIAACLKEDELILFQKTALSLGLETIIEIHNEEELKKALKASPKIIGVNNRNLKDFTVSLDRSLTLGRMIPGHIYKISESGIKTAQETDLLKKAGFSGVLVGETLMKASDPAQYIRRLKNEM